MVVSVLVFFIPNTIDKVSAHPHARLRLDNPARLGLVSRQDSAHHVGSEQDR